MIESYKATLGLAKRNHVTCCLRPAWIEDHKFCIVIPHKQISRTQTTQNTLNIWTEPKSVEA